MSGVLHAVLNAVNIAALAYFAILNVVYFVLMVLGWRGINAYLDRRLVTNYTALADSTHAPPISIIVPAFNEEPVIVDVVRALLRADYPKLEVVIVNDGSSDGTLAVLDQEFALVRLDRVPRARLATADVRGLHQSRVDARLVVVDKQNGGKADSINAGLCFARYPLVCAVDSDTMIDDDALLRLAKPFMDDATTVACGGVVRVANGSRVEGGRVRDVKTPSGLLENIQIVEYLRAFLAGRIGWSKCGALLIISGAFGLFQRQTVIEAGGYDATTVGEDAELVVRLHRHCRERGTPYRVVFVADPVCWTEAPASLRVLCRQRNRWHRGLVETLWRHRGMIGRPRYGAVGLFALPYFLVFEALGPLLELAGYLSFSISIALGTIDAAHALAFFALAMLVGLVLSIGSLVIEERAFRRYRRWSCTLRLIVASVVENFGFRQVLSVVRSGAFITLARGGTSWGAMPRAGFSGSALEAVPARDDDGRTEVPAAQTESEPPRLAA